MNKPLFERLIQCGTTEALLGYCEHLLRQPLGELYICKTEEEVEQLKARMCPERLKSNE